MAAPRRQIWIDGRLVPWASATVHLLAQSVQRGYLAFDVLSCHDGAEGPAVFGLREHAQRFLDSTALAGMRVQLDLAGVCAAIGQTVRANPGASLIKVSAYYPGESADVLPREPFATVAVAVYRPEDVGGSSAPLPPARLQIARTLKLPPDVLSPQAKLAGSYTYATIAKVRARADGFDDVLLLDRQGHVAELPTQSFFWVDAGELCTSPLDIVLDGITRRAVIELARDEGLPVHEVRMPAEKLARVEEAFVTSTTVGVRAVERISETWLPKPVPGPLAERLAARLRRVLEGADPRFSPRWLEPV